MIHFWLLILSEFQEEICQISKRRPKARYIYGHILILPRSKLKFPKVGKLPEIWQHWWWDTGRFSSHVHFYSGFGRIGGGWEKKRRRWWRTELLMRWQITTPPTVAFLSTCVTISNKFTQCHLEQGWMKIKRLSSQNPRDKFPDV